MKVGFLLICVAYVYLHQTSDALVHFIITPKSQVRAQEGANVTLWWDYTSDMTLTLAQWGTVNDEDNLESIIAQQSSSGDIKYPSTNFKDRAFIEGLATLHLLNVKVSDSGRYGCEIFFQGESSPTLKNVTELIVSERSTAAPLTPGGRTGDNNTTTQPVYVALVVVILILIVLVLVYLYTTRTRRGTLSDKSNLQDFGPSVELNEVNQGEPYEDAEMRQSPTRETLESSLQDYSVIPPITPGQVKKDWEIPRDSLVFVKVIGKGAFGQVAKGMAQGIRNSKENQLVAIKMLRENATDENRQHLLSELNMMKNLEQHQNVIELLGCVTKSDPVMVITEYAPYGDLLGFLRKSRGLHDTYYDDPDIKPLSSLNSKQLFGFASDIANGMEFLSSKKIVHRDLAARNVLVGEEEICKITDFGMAKDVYKEDLYRRTATGRLPVKWTALESLVYGICTTMSDLWSFGIVMYEIFTIGGSPYPKIEGKSLASLLQEGYRMPKPPHLDKKLYDVMVSCWNETPEKRPAFAELRKRMEVMQNQKEIYVNFKSYDTNLYQIADEQDA